MMLHHFVQRGQGLSDLLSLSPLEKAFMKISMLIEIEDDAKRWGSR